MGYLDELTKKAEVLDKLADCYLEQFDFMTTDAMCERIWNKSWEIYKAHSEDVDLVPELYRDEVECVVDGTMPYLASALKPGSLKKSLGLSMASVDAHLRNLLERLEGRTQQQLAFGFIAD
jgi:hypothetical protein